MNKVLISAMSFILLVLLTSLTRNSIAYDNKITHKSLTREATNQLNSKLNDYVINNLGYSDGINLTLYGMKVIDWIKEGSYAEDVPNCRASNHFHDPLKDWNKSQMSDDTSTFQSLGIRSQGHA